MSGLKDILQGKPLRTPLHTLIVHFPLAFFGLAVVLDVASWLVSAPALQLVPGAFWAVVGGVLSALVAALFGFADYTSIRRDHPAKKTATTHMLLNLAAVALFGLGLFLRHPDLHVQRTPVIPLIVDLAAFGMLMVSGYLGGKIVYNDGVGVGRHRRSTPQPDRTIELGAVPAGDFTRVCRADEIVDGQIVRVRLNGTVMALANSKGRYFAVQEFCTHRYGPLSEGNIENDQIVCPWHRSCFELKTGAVAHGPAKVALKTYEVSVRTSDVYIKAPEPVALAAQPS
jgi:nitrite reductase/ring-hydroxylating ferredoxin subunit/uncharacterized membrane protein